MRLFLLLVLFVLSLVAGQDAPAAPTTTEGAAPGAAPVSAKETPAEKAAEEKQSEEDIMALDNLRLHLHGEEHDGVPHISLEVARARLRQEHEINRFRPAIRALLDSIHHRLERDWHEDRHKKFTEKPEVMDIACLEEALKIYPAALCLTIKDVAAKQFAGQDSLTEENRPKLARAVIVQYLANHAEGSNKMRVGAKDGEGKQGSLVQTGAQSKAQVRTHEAENSVLPQLANFTQSIVVEMNTLYGADAERKLSNPMTEAVERQILQSCTKRAPKAELPSLACAAMLDAATEKKFEGKNPFDIANREALMKEITIIFTLANMKREQDKTEATESQAVTGLKEFIAHVGFEMNVKYGDKMLTPEHEKEGAKAFRRVFRLRCHMVSRRVMTPEECMRLADAQKLLFPKPASVFKNGFLKRCTSEFLSTALTVILMAPHPATGANDASIETVWPKGCKTEADNGAEAINRVGSTKKLSRVERYHGNGSWYDPKLAAPTCELSADLSLAWIVLGNTPRDIQRLSDMVEMDLARAIRCGGDCNTKFMMTKFQERPNGKVHIWFKVNSLVGHADTPAPSVEVASGNSTGNNSTSGNSTLTQEPPVDPNNETAVLLQLLHQIRNGRKTRAQVFLEEDASYRLSPTGRRLLSTDSRSNRRAQSLDPYGAVLSDSSLLQSSVVEVPAAEQQQPAQQAAPKHPTQDASALTEEQQAIDSKDPNSFQPVYPIEVNALAVCEALDKLIKLSSPRIWEGNVLKFIEGLEPYPPPRDPCAEIKCTALDQCHQQGKCHVSEDGEAFCDDPTQPDGFECDDKNPNSMMDVCTAGVCKGKEVVDPCKDVFCQPLSQCHDPGQCLAGNCSNPIKPDGFKCNDTNPLTENDICHSGICSGTMKADPCADVTCPEEVGICQKVGSCVQGQCTTPIEEDGFPCAVVLPGDAGNPQNGKCFSGVCKPDSLEEPAQPANPDNPDEDPDAGPSPPPADPENPAPPTPEDPENPTPPPGEEPAPAPTEPEPTPPPAPAPEDAACKGVVCPDHGTCYNPSVCVGGTCTRSPLPDKSPCDDGNVMTKNDTCVEGVCQGKLTDPCEGVECKASSQCHLPGTCVAGRCSDNNYKVPNTPCDDHDNTTIADVCALGICSGTPDPCLGVVCPAPDQCHGQGQCLNGICSDPPKRNGIRCNDNNATTRNDTCLDGVCIGEVPDPCEGIVCQAQDQCHFIGVCKAGVCTNPEKPSNTTCNDARNMTINDHCEGGVCVGVTVTQEDMCASVTCRATGPELSCKMDGTCSLGECSYPNQPDGTHCNEDGGRCQQGVCVTPPAVEDPCLGVVCAALDQCHDVGVCQLGVCSQPLKANGTACDDTIALTENDVCTLGICSGTPVDPCKGVVCAATDECHMTGVCEQGKCTNPPVANSGNFTCHKEGAGAEGICRDGLCEILPPAGTPCDGVVCTPLSQCHVVGECATGLCSNPLAPANTSCDDGDLKTVNDVCINGVCIGTTPTPTDLCETITCASAGLCHLVGECINGLCTDPLAEAGTACLKGGLNGTCTAEGNCNTTLAARAALCNDVKCPAANDCALEGVCVDGVCVPRLKDDGASCNDTRPDTINDVCTAGQCGGTIQDRCITEAVVCEVLDQCHTVGECFAGVCSNPAKPDGVSCNDSRPETDDDVCVSGTCVGTFNYSFDPLCIGVRCPAGDQCHENGVCHQGNCTFPPKPLNTSCDDENPNTGPDMCVQGVCYGKINPPKPEDPCWGITCVAPDDCHTAGICNAGNCTQPVRPDGVSCDDHNPKTTNDVCHQGICAGTAPTEDGEPQADPCDGVVCKAMDMCHTVGQCIAGRCSNPVMPDGTECDDNDPDTEKDACVSGICAGTTKNVNDTLAENVDAPKNDTRPVDTTSTNATDGNTTASGPAPAPAPEEISPEQKEEEAAEKTGEEEEVIVGAGKAKRAANGPYTIWTYPEMESNEFMEWCVVFVICGGLFLYVLLQILSEWTREKSKKEGESDPMDGTIPKILRRVCMVLAITIAAFNVTSGMDQSHHKVFIAAHALNGWNTILILQASIQVASYLILLAWALDNRRLAGLARYRGYVGMIAQAVFFIVCISFAVSLTLCARYDQRKWMWIYMFTLGCTCLALGLLLLGSFIILRKHTHSHRAGLNDPAKHDPLHDFMVGFIGPVVVVCFCVTLFCTYWYVHLIDESGAWFHNWRKVKTPLPFSLVVELISAFFLAHYSDGPWSICHPHHGYDNLDHDEPGKSVEDEFAPPSMYISAGGESSVSPYDQDDYAMLGKGESSTRGTGGETGEGGGEDGGEPGTFAEYKEGDYGSPGAPVNTLDRSRTDDTFLGEGGEGEWDEDDAPIIRPSDRTRSKRAPDAYGMITEYDPDEEYPAYDDSRVGDYDQDEDDVKSQPREPLATNNDRRSVTEGIAFGESGGVGYSTLDI